MRNKITIGTHQEVHIKPFRKDRLGLITGTVERHRKEEFDEPDWQWLNVTRAPAVALVPCVNVSRAFDDASGYAIYTYSFEGVDPGDTQFSQEGPVQCSLDGSDTEEPIEVHPDFRELFKKYAGRKTPTGRFDFFEGVELTVEGEKGFNPLHGVSHFLSITLIWTRTSITRSIPVNLLSKVDCINSPRGNELMSPPSLGGRRNWLQLAPAVSQRGNCVQIARRWMASGKNGWNKDIYGERHSAGGRV